MNPRVTREQRVSRQRPCPVCGKPDYCIFSADGTFVFCQRQDTWNGKSAIKHTEAGWMFPAAEGDARPRVVALPPARTPLPPRQQLDAVYRALAEMLPLDAAAREDLIARRRFPAAEERGLYFRLPRSGSENERISEAVIARFGMDLVERVPGFSARCKGCDGKGLKDGSPCRGCGGLGRLRPRFRSVRGSRHDYGALACDENGLAFWGSTRTLPTPTRQKYVLLSSSRAEEPSLSGTAFYHVAGREYPEREVFITEGVIKAEILAWKLQRRVIGLPGTSMNEPTLAAVVRLVQAWEPELVVVAFDADKLEQNHAGVLRGEQKLVDALLPLSEVATAEWNIAGGKGLDDLLVQGGTFERVARGANITPRPRVPRPCLEPGEVDSGPSLAEVQAETLARISRRFDPALRDTRAIIAPPPGTSKTGSVLRALETAPMDAAIAVSRHAQAAEMVERAASEICQCGQVRGTCPEHRLLLQHDEGRNASNCEYIEVVEAAQANGYGSQTGKLICGTLAHPICPVRATCSYHLQFSESGSHVAPLETVIHRTQGTAAAEVVILDDIDGGRLLSCIDVDRDVLDRARSSPQAPLVRPLLEILDRAMAEASEHGARHREAYQLLDRVSRANGTTLERVLAQVPPLAVRMEEPSAGAFEQAVPGQLLDLVEMLHEELPLYLSGESFTSGLRVAAGHVEVRRLNLPAVDAWGDSAVKGRAVVVLSATPDPITRQWIRGLGGEPIAEYHPRVALPASVRVVQDVGGFYGKGTVENSDNRVLLARAAAYIAEFRPLRPAIVTHRALVPSVVATLGIPEERVLYFGNQRGSNALRDADLLLVIGTPSMSPDDAYSMTCAAYRGAGAPPSARQVLAPRRYGGWRDARGQGREVEVLTFADQRVAEVFETARRDELLQAIYRIRPHDVGQVGDDRASATVVLMTEFPVEGLRVDELRFSGNAELYETSVRRLEEAFTRLQTGRGVVTSRGLAEAAGLHIERAQEYLRQVSAVRSHPAIKVVRDGWDQTAETDSAVAPRSGCTCAPCPANEGDACSCGRFWRDTGGRWRCGRHDPDRGADRAAGAFTAPIRADLGPAPVTREQVRDEGHALVPDRGREQSGHTPPGRGTERVRGGTQANELLTADRQ